MSLTDHFERQSVSSSKSSVSHVSGDQCFIKRRVVLIPVDGSENSMRAMMWYVQQASVPGDEIILFHSVDTNSIIPSMGYTVAGPPMELASVESKLREKDDEVTVLKKNYLKVLHDANLDADFLIGSKTSHAGEAIVQECREKQVEYVVMGSRGHGMIRRTFLGSISDYVLHHAHIPVTIIPPVSSHSHHSH